MLKLTYKQQFLVQIKKKKKETVSSTTKYENEITKSIYKCKHKANQMSTKGV